VTRTAGPAGWTTPADVTARVRKRWMSGALLRQRATGEPFQPIDVPLRGPSSADLAERLDAARQWAAAIERAAESGRAFRIETVSVGGRHLGRSELPGRAVVDTLEQAVRLLGIGGPDGAVAAFDEVLRIAATSPAAYEWATANPLRAVELAGEWPAILAARDWLDWHRGSGRYLREIDAPGVDTKLVERHRVVLARLLRVSASAGGFLDELGLAAKPGSVRLRFDPRVLGMPEGLTEATLRVSELAALRPQVRRALIIENEVSYLSAPIPDGGVVVWGRGYDAGSPTALDWLREAASRGTVDYWGDLDTHGFAILNRVRSHLPGVRSVLMDRATLVAHESRWGTEPTPTNASLPHLTVPERELYENLVTDRYARALRLEQERLDWGYVVHRLTAPPPTVDQ
jgi:hypothetical protein